MSNLKFGVNYKKNFPGAVLDSSLSWQRFIKALGSTETPDMRNGDVSRQSQIMNLNVNYMKWLTSLPVDAYYELNLGVQYTPDNLTLQDQLTIGDRWSGFVALMIVEEFMVIRDFIYRTRSILLQVIKT